MKPIDVYVDGKLFNDPKTNKKVDLVENYKERLNTQRRLGNQSGSLYFIPFLLLSILDKYDKNKANPNGYKKLKDKWFETMLNSVYFELTSGRIVPLYAVEKISLETCSLRQPPSVPQNILPLKLSNLPQPLPQPVFRSKKKVYSVFIDYNIVEHEYDKKNKTYNTKIRNYNHERVNLGDEINLAEGGIEDLTLDHVVPIYSVLEAYREQLPYISMIDQLIKLHNGDYRVGTITHLIDSDDPESLKELQKELNFVMRATRGLRVCSQRVNKLSV